jgi:hypothetical protein
MSCPSFFATISKMETVIFAYSKNNCHENHV